MSIVNIFFKKQTRADEIEEVINGLASVILNRDFTPDELVLIYEKLGINLTSYMEKLKSDLLVESKKANRNYKDASFVLTTFRNIKETIEKKPNE